MAEALARHMLGDERFRFRSAGIAAQTGASASPHAVEAMAERGLSLAEHHARNVDAELLAESDVIFCMTAGHANALRRRFGEEHRNVFVLREAAQLLPLDVADPYGGSLDDYRRCAEQIEESLVALSGQLKALSSPT